MSKALVIAIAIATALLAVSACVQHPIYQVQDAQVVTTSGKALTPAQVRQAIVTAGTALGWTVVDAQPGKLEGTLNLRTHTAVVDIPYSATAYSIVFKRGDNLNVEGDKIHKNYNGWVQNLDRGIRTELSRL
jgi:hypothetical protein